MSNNRKNGGARRQEHRPPRQPAQRPQELDSQVFDPVDLDDLPSEDEYEPFKVFKLKGKWYTVPGHPRANLVLKVMWRSKEVGEKEASFDVAREILGPELVSVLEGARMTQDQMEGIMNRVLSLVYNPETDDQGN
jgi:hypothetical protein